MLLIRYSLILLLINIKNICAIDDEILITTSSIFDDAIIAIQNMEKDFKQEREQLKIDRKKFKEEKQINRTFDKTDVIQLNVGGELIATTRQTLTLLPKSLFSILFNGRWDEQLSKDENENFFFDFNPTLFRHLLDQLQLSNIETDPLLVQPFRKFTKKLDIQHLMLKKPKQNILTANVNGQIMTIRREIVNLTSSNSIIISKMNETDVFIDNHPKLFRNLIKIRRENAFIKSKCKQKLFSTQMLRNPKICIQKIQLSNNSKWNSNGMNIGRNDAQISGQGIDIDREQTLFIADSSNNRIIEVKKGAAKSEISINRNNYNYHHDSNQLYSPVDVVVDDRNDGLIICNRGHRKVVQWSRQNSQVLQTIVSNIQCYGLALNDEGYIYVVDDEKHEVRKWKLGEHQEQGILVAGGNGRGAGLNQFYQPRFIFIDDDESVYVSDYGNHRVMKWIKGAREGIVVAGGQGQGINLSQLSSPNGIFVDDLETVYIADTGNNRIVRWLKDANQGDILLKENNQLSSPFDLLIDDENNLILNNQNHQRIQKFSIIQ